MKQNKSETEQPAEHHQPNSVTSGRSYRRWAILAIIVSLLAISGNQFFSADVDSATAKDSWKTAESVYDFTVTDIEGNEVSMEKYRGRVLLIVNVASECGFTNKNYPQLQELFTKHGDAGLSVLGFPCNQFGHQEPGDSVCIRTTASKFKVTFDMFSKLNVNGDEAHPLYKFLKMKQKGIIVDAIKWNFTKFLVDRNGIPVNRYSPNTEPKSIEADIAKLL